MSYIRGALLAGGFRTWRELASMNFDAQRNAAIVELAANSRESAATYQAMDDHSLAGAVALMVMMRIGEIRSDEDLRTMSLDEMRNTFIVEVAGFTGRGASLQALDNLGLVRLALTGHDGVRGALLLGRGSTWRQLDTMSFDQQRNALINILAAHSSHSIGHYQGLPDSDLAGCAGVMMILRDGGCRDVPSLRTMTTDDQRNTLIVEIASYSHLGSALQAFSNGDLARIALGDPFLPRTSQRIEPATPDPELFLPPLDLEVRYVGIQCFAETDFDNGSDSDEPYLIITTATPTGQQTIRTRIYDDVDAGESRTDDVLLYRGPVDALAIQVHVMEHDEGDPDKFRDVVDEAADKVAGAITGALATVPGGPVLSGLFVAAWKKWGGDIKQAITELIGDDRLGTADVVLDRRGLRTLARTPLREFRGVRFTIESPLVEGGGASYKAAFTIRPV